MMVNEAPTILFGGLSLATGFKRPQSSQERRFMCPWQYGEVAGLSRRQQRLVVSSERLARYGVSRYSKRRALAALVSAGLIRVRSRRNRSPEIDVLFPVANDNNDHV